MSLQGTVIFSWVTDDCDWASNDRLYSFQPVNRDGIHVTGVKHPDRTLELVIQGPFSQVFTFLEPAPQAESQAMIVMFNWSEGRINLSLNGKVVQTRTASDPVFSVQGPFAPTKDDVTAIFQMAFAFRVAAQTYSQAVFVSPFLVQKCPPLIVPGAVLEAFSTELFLKCLYLIDCGVPSRGHSLKALFESLSASTQTKMRTEYELWKTAGNKLAFSQKEGFSIEFDDVLNDCDRGFEQWRYLHEPNLLSDKRWHGSGILIAAKKIAEELRPDLLQAIPSTSPTH